MNKEEEATKGVRRQEERGNGEHVKVIQLAHPITRRTRNRYLGHVVHDLDFIKLLYV